MVIRSGSTQPLPGLGGTVSSHALFWWPDSVLIAEVSGSSWAQLESNAIQLTGVGGGAERLRKTRGVSRGLASLMPAAGFGRFLPKSSGKTHTPPTTQPLSKKRVGLTKADESLLKKRGCKPRKAEKVPACWKSQIPVESPGPGGGCQHTLLQGCGSRV